jgi:3-oxoacyl-[acyl-carrier protein] reductase
MNVLITGVSKGIGKALRNEFISQGHDVWGISREDDLSATESPSYHHVQFDWIDFNDLSATLRKVMQGCKFDIVINNAGYLSKGNITDDKIEGFNNHMKVNVWNVLEITRLLIIKGMLGDGAHVVNIGSMGGVQGSLKFEGLFSYSASKAALATLTECLDAEYGGNLLSFNYLALGAVNTEMLKEAFPGYISQVNPENMAKYIVAFSLTSGQLMSGKIIQVSKVDPKG